MRQEEAYLCANGDVDVISRLPKRERRKSSVWEFDIRSFMILEEKKTIPRR